MSTFNPGTGPYNYPQITISTPLASPPQLFTNARTLLDANVVGVLLFRNGVLQTEGPDYTRDRSKLTLVIPPIEGDTLVARVFGRGRSLGGPNPERYIAPWTIPVVGAFDGVSGDYRITIGPTIFGTCNGVNRLFTYGVTLKRAQLWKNGVLQTINVDFTFAPTAIVFLTGAEPQADDILTIYGWAA